MTAIARTTKAAALPQSPASFVPGPTFKRALALAGLVAPTRSSNPLLPALSLHSLDGALTVSCTNLEMILHQQVTAADLPDFHVMANAQKLRQASAFMAESTVPLSVDGKQLRIGLEEDGSVMTLETRPGEELRIFERMGLNDTPAYTHRVPAAELRNALRAVSYAASNEAFQAVFRGIALKQRNGGYEVVASDGFRAAIYTVSAPLPDAIIPKRVAQVIAELLKGAKAGDEVELAVVEAGKVNEGAAWLAVRTGGVQLYFRCMDGTFPDYGRVIESDTAKWINATWSREGMLRRLKMLRLTADHNSNHRIEFSYRGDRLSLKAEGDDGSMQATLPLEAPVARTKDGADTAFNALYLMDALGNTAAEHTLIRASHEPKPNGRVQISAGPYLAIVVAFRV